MVHVLDQTSGPSVDHGKVSKLVHGGNLAALLRELWGGQTDYMMKKTTNM